MPLTFRVTIAEVTSVRRSKDIEAFSEDEARKIAEEQDWSQWDLDISSDDPDSNPYIETIEEV